MRILIYCGLLGCIRVITGLHVLGKYIKLYIDITNKIYLSTSCFCGKYMIRYNVRDLEAVIRGGEIFQYLHYQIIFVGPVFPKLENKSTFQNKLFYMIINTTTFFLVMVQMKPIL